MKKLLSLIICIIITLAQTATCIADSALTADEQRMLAAIDKKKNDVVSIEKKIWEYREFGMEEYKSSALLMDMLEKEGFAVQRSVTGKDLVKQ